MNCNVCGTQLADGAVFCPNCGNAVQANNPQQPQQQPNFQQPNFQQPNFQQPNFQQPNFQQPGFQQPGFQQPFQQPDTPTPGKALGIVSMILGILSLVLFCYYYLSIPCAIVSIILSCIGKSQAKKAGKSLGMATAGLVCSIVALAIDIIIIATGAAILAELGVF